MRILIIRSSGTKTPFRQLAEPRGQTKEEEKNSEQTRGFSFLIGLGGGAELVLKAVGRRQWSLGGKERAQKRGKGTERGALRVSAPHVRGAGADLQRFCACLAQQPDFAVGKGNEAKGKIATIA